MTVREIFTILVSSTALFATIGGVCGFALGRFNPGYYRFVLRAERNPDFDPIAVGIGQGITQGLSGGAFIGVLLILILAWFRSRMPPRSDSPDRQSGKMPGSTTDVLRFRLPSIAIGGIIGFVVGSIWTAIIGPFTDGPPSMTLSFAVYALTLTCTGLVVGAVRRMQALVGLGTAIISLVCAAFVVGPNDGWLMLWVIVFGGSGLLCGPLIGGLHYAVHRRRVA